MTDDRTLQPGDPIGVLGLSPRPHNALRRNGIHTIADLTAATPNDITDIRNLGVTYLGEIESKLAAHGLALRTEEPPES
jgi:DNA-directed RNA polymerase subunit alpha